MSPRESNAGTQPVAAELKSITLSHYFALLLMMLFLAGDCAAQEPDPVADSDAPGTAAADETATDEPADDEWAAARTVAVEKRLTLQDAFTGKPVDLPPGNYDVYFSSPDQFVLIDPQGDLSVTLDAATTESNELDNPNTAYVQELDGEVFIRATSEDGTTFVAAAELSKVQSRSIVVYPRPDLTISLRPPGSLYYNEEKNLAVTLRNIGTADATRVNFFIYTVDEDNRRIDSMDLVSPTSGTLRCSKQTYDRISCFYSGTVPRGSLRNLNVRVRFKQRDSGDRAWPWKFDLHADCSTQAYHGSGGAIRELNERNNTATAEVLVRRRPDLRPAGVSASRVRIGDRYYQATRKNVLNPVRVRVWHEPSALYTGYIDNPTTGIRVEATFSMFTIISVDGSAGGFNCSFSNNTKKVTCTGGRLPRRSGSSSYPDASITVNVVPLASAPIGVTPVFVSVDPGRRIAESNEGNNARPYNLYIRN